MITVENWTYCQYKSGNLSAFVTLGASPEILNNDFQYFVTVIDDQHNEIFQQEFTSLNAACSHINQKYTGLWQLNDSLKPLQEGGCSTCVAH